MSFADRAAARFHQFGETRLAYQKRAWSEYERVGLPDRKDEAWKYTALTEITGVDWQSDQACGDLPAAALELRQRWAADFDVLIVINGEVRLSESRLSTEAREALHVGPEVAAEPWTDGFTNLAAALSRPSFELRVTARVQRPLLIVRAQTGARGWDPGYSRIHLAANAELALMDIFCGEGLSCALTDVELSEGAHFSWLRVQSERPAAVHFSDVRMRIQRAAVAHVCQVNGGAKWSRGLVHAELLGSDAEAHINGLTFGRDRQHVDQRIEIRHLAAGSSSSQLFKSVLKDEARGVLNGKIYIAPHAQQVNSTQYNHALLMGEGCESDAKPELEIYADDVKANHGASVGRLDEDKLFYLQSRGIAAQAGRAMLARAFVDDVAMKMPTRDLRQALGIWIGELTQ